jgi:alkylation response protein AidB-like acyl-CoA dehydrogenase
MFQMMNEGRISVGLGAAALGYRSYRLSVQYAGQRSQAGRSVTPAECRSPRLLLAQKCYAEGASALSLYCARFVDLEKTDAKAAALLGLLRDGSALLLLQ